MTGPANEPGGANPIAAAIAEAAAAGAGDAPELPLADDRQLAELDRNDFGNGQRFAARHGLDCRHTAEAGWYVFDGQRWKRSLGQRSAPGAEIVMRAHRTAAAIKDEAAALKADVPAQADPAVRKNMLERAQKHHGFAIASGMAGKIAAMLSSAEPYLRVPADAFDAHPLLFNVANGTLDLAAADIAPRAFARTDMLTHLSPVAFDAEAAAPEFRRFIARILPDDEVRRFVQRWLGYCLCGLTDEQKLVINYGTGANGKSVLYNVVAAVVGDYSQTVPIQTFLHNDRRGAGDPTPDLVMLQGAHLVMAAEPEIGARLGESLVKVATGGDRITARHLFEGMFTFTPRFKLVLSANVKPAVRGQDEGIWRRIILVPFEVVIPPEERDPKLTERLISCEAAGILNWLLDGWREYRERGLDVPAAVAEATAEYRAGSDSVYEFVSTCTIEAAGERIRAGILFDAYRRWCQAGGLEPVSLTRFGFRLGDLKIAKQRIGGFQFYTGRAIVEGAVPDQDSAGQWGQLEPPTGGDALPEVRG